MLARFRETLRRIGDLAIRSPVGSFLRENRVIAPILAGVALLIFSWIVAGAIIEGPEERGEVSNQAAQAPEDGGGSPPEPGVENRNADSYAAYESKDPFRQLIDPAETEETTGGESTIPASTDGGESTTGEDTDDSNGGDEPRNRDRDDGGGPDGPDRNGPDRDGPGGSSRDQYGDQYGDDLFDSGGSLRRPSGARP